MNRRHLLPLTLLMVCTMLPSCGTVITRTKSTFGAYPFHAVVTDAQFMANLFADGEMVGMPRGGPKMFMIGFFSFPFDLVVDAVALPIDLGAWVFGYYKFGVPKAPRKPSVGDVTGSGD